MEQTFLKNRNATADETAMAWLDTGYALNVALVYQDVLTRHWAEQVRERIAELVGTEALHCTEWEIGDLREQRGFSEGAAALARANVIVVSLYAADRLPPTFYLWVNVWLQQRSKLPGALVALIARPAELTAEAMETRRYLCAVASQGGLDFLECDQPGEPIRVLGADIMPWAKVA